jgi:hypothetical protein
MQCNVWCRLAVQTSSQQDGRLALQVMYKNDVYAASFRLGTPTAAGRARLGALWLQCRRLSDDGKSASRRTAGLNRSANLDAKGVASAAAGSRVGRFVLQHRLPEVQVFDSAVAASLRMPAQAEVGSPFELAMTVETDGAFARGGSALRVKASVGTTGAVQLLGDRIKTVAVEAGAPCEVSWQAVGKEKGFVDVLGTVEPDSEATTVRAGDSGGAVVDATSAESPARSDSATTDFALELTGGMMLTKRGIAAL